jgi:hypothetical protein
MRTVPTVLIPFFLACAMLSSGGIGITHFHVDRQRALIQGHGQLVVVFPVLTCACLLDDRQHDPTCATCHGTGRFYPPSAAYTTTLLLHHEDSKRIFEEPGTWTQGVLRASILPGVRLCERDRVQLMDILDVFADEVLTRGLDDRVRFTADVHLLVVADRERVYTPGVDYVLTPPATVTWHSTGTQPAFGSQYSVKYEAAPLFLVVNDAPRLRVEHRIPQAQEVVLMRLDRLAEDF